MTLTEKEKRIAWEKADYVLGKDLHVWRKDESGHLMRFSSYGQFRGDYGWDVMLLGEDTGCCDNTCRLKAVRKKID